MVRNTIWNRLNRKSVSTKSNYEISKRTNIPEEKVKEIMEGEREIPSDRVDDFVNAIKENDKVEKQITMANIRKWIAETDLRELRKKFNYASQGELASALGVDASVVCRLEGKKLDHVSDQTLQKYYDFLNDELNVKINKKNDLSSKILKTKIRGKINVSDVDYDKAYAWYQNFDLKAWLNDNDMSYKDLIIRLGYKPSSISLLSSFINRKIDVKTTGKNILLKVYAYINGPEKAEISPVETQNDKDGELVQEVENNAPEQEKAEIIKDMEEVTNYNQFNQVQDISTTTTFPYDMNTATYNPETGSFAFTREVVDEEKVTVYKHIWDNQQKLIEEQQDKIKKLELQISRYEKLIDMIER